MRIATDIATRFVTTLLVVMHVVVGLSASMHSFSHVEVQHRSRQDCSGGSDRHAADGFDASLIVRHDHDPSHQDAPHLCCLCSLITSGTITSPLTERLDFTIASDDWSTIDTTIALRDIHRSFSPRSPPLPTESGCLS